MTLRLASFLLLLSAPCWAFEGHADENNSQSYIDQVKKELRTKEIKKQAEGEVEVTEVGPDPYLQSIKKKFSRKEDSPEEDQESYTGRLKKRLSSDVQRDDPDEPTFLEKQKLKIKPKEVGGAIQALNEGRSELHAKKEGDIHHAFGLRYGVSLNRELSAPSGVQARDFNSVYGGNYVPDLTLFYEYQPFHSEWFGNIGIVGMAGLAYFYGLGKFGSTIPKPDGSGDFPEASQVKFQFFTIPVTLAIDYRFNLFRILRPYVLVGPTAIGYVEMRNDNVSGNRGHSEGILLSFGASLSLDWVKEAFDLYSTFGVKHYYLTVDYSRLNTFAGDVGIGISGFTAGLTFEY